MMKGKVIACTALSTLLLAGCATTNDVAEVRALAQKALDTANSAEAKAERAGNDARSSSRSADQALQAAQAAQRCCSQNSEKIKRAFERSQYK